MSDCRSILNVDSFGVLSEDGLFLGPYALIDHIRTGTQYGPINGTGWYNGTAYWNSDSLDSNGWPNTSAANTNQWGGSFVVPDSSNFSGPYILSWDGDGTVAFLSGTWTVTGNTGAVQNSNGNYSNTGSSTSVKLTLTYSGSQGRIQWRANNSDRSSIGEYLRNIRFYRQEDEADLAAGNVFRTGWKQQIVDHCPYALRFLGWGGGNNCNSIRYSNVRPSTYSTLIGPTYFHASPPYTVTSGTNQYTLSSVTDTPASMQHGEVAVCLIGSTAKRCGDISVTAITQANPGSVTATGHGFSTGDIIVHKISSGMTQLNLVPCTITVVDANTYTLGVDTTSFTAFSGTCTACQYLTLQVGSGNDRVAYPIVFVDGQTYASETGSAGPHDSGYIAANAYKTFIFDKNSIASSTVNGVWLTTASSGSTGDFYPADVPPEIVARVITELNAMNPRAPIGAWINLSYLGLISQDQDYSLADNLPVQTVSTILNGIPNNCPLLVEFSNETWNAGTSFQQAPYLARWGQIRTSGVTNTGDKAYGASIRSLMHMKDIKDNISDSRIKYVLGGQGTLGISGLNASRLNGNTNINADTFYISLGLSSPMDYYDYWATAAYFDPKSGYDAANLATLTASWVGGDDTTRQTYVTDGMIATSSDAETVAYYRDTRLGQYASALLAKGKTAINYEGGWNRAVTGGSLTSDETNFLVEVKAQSEWAVAQLSYCNAVKGTSGASHPAILNMLGHRWGHAYPDTYSGGVEGAALDAAWAAISEFNTDQFPASSTKVGWIPLTHDPDELDRRIEQQQQNTFNRQKFLAAIAEADLRIAAEKSKPVKTALKRIKQDIKDAQQRNEDYNSIEPLINAALAATKTADILAQAKLIERAIRLAMEQEEEEAAIILLS